MTGPRTNDDDAPWLGGVSAPAAARGRRVTPRPRPPRYSGVWIATAAMFAISPLLASNSLHSSALLSMLPFAAMLAIASIGQTLVIQQRGLDLTVPGMILLSTVILTQHAAGSNGGLLLGILLVVLACVASGTVSGLAVTRFGITPLVATLGVNALLLGTVYQLTGGQATASSPPGLVELRRPQDDRHPEHGADRRRSPCS